MRRPVSLAAGNGEQLLGNIKLRIHKDGSICRALAEAEYHEDLGARSLSTAVKDEVETKLIQVYLAEGEEIEEGGQAQELIVSVNDGDIVVGKFQN